MPRNSRTGKFVNIDGSDDDVYNALYKLMLKHALSYGNPDNPMMDADEIMCELSEELAKGLKAYSTLPFEQKIAVIRRMFDFRLAELRYRYYLTHRKEHVHDLSVESDSEAIAAQSSREPLPEDQLLAKDKLKALRDALSENSRMVLDCIMSGTNPRFAEIVKLNALRPQGSDKIKPYMVADALMISEREARISLDEIRRVYRSIYGH